MVLPTQKKLVSKLASAKGLDSAHEGAHHWLFERVAAALLAPFAIWLVYSVLVMKDATYEEFTGWFQNPLHAIGMIVFVLVGFFHAASGLQVIIEDYVSGHGKKLVSIIAVKILFGVLAVASVFSILKMAL